MPFLLPASSTHDLCSLGDSHLTSLGDKILVRVDAAMGQRLCAQLAPRHLCGWVPASALAPGSHSTAPANSALCCVTATSPTRRYTRERLLQLPCSVQASCQRKNPRARCRRRHSGGRVGGMPLCTAWAICPPLRTYAALRAELCASRSDQRGDRILGGARVPSLPTEGTARRAAA